MSLLIFSPQVTRGTTKTRPREQCKFCNYLLDISLVSKGYQIGLIGQSGPTGPAGLGGPSSGQGGPVGHVGQGGRVGPGGPGGSGDQGG